MQYIDYTGRPYHTQTTDWLNTTDMRIQSQLKGFEVRLGIAAKDFH